MYGGQSTNLPMKVNMSGVLPVIFASTFLALPGTIISFVGPAEGSFWYGVQRWLTQTHPFYIVLYLLFIFGFAYFYPLSSSIRLKFPTTSRKTAVLSWVTVPVSPPPIS